MIYKRPDSGFYQYKFRFGGRWYRGSTKHRNKIAAGRVEDALKTRLANSRVGIEEPGIVPLLRDFAPRFLDMMRVNLRRSGARTYEVSLRNLLPVFGSKLLDGITPAMVAEFRDARLRAGRSGGTVNRDLATLRRIFSVALKLDVVRATPFVARRVEFCKERGRERVLGFGEERRYLAAASQPLRDVATVILETGLRPGEAFSIRCGDVHLFVSPPFLHVPDGKTDNARRDVSLTARAVEVLSRRVAQAKGEFVFPARVGSGNDWAHPVDYLRAAHRRALRLSGVSGFCLYDLRHTFASRAVEAGMDALTLKAVMGHADLKTTSRYVHPTFRHLADALAKVERFRAEREIAEAESARAVPVAVQ